MNRLIISIGSNTSDRRERMAKALQWLSSTFHVIASSNIYETEEYHGRHAPYFNCVICAESNDADTVVISMLKDFEHRQGRTAESKATGLVPIDLDLMAFNGRKLRPQEFNRDYFLIGYREIIGRIKGSVPT